MTEIQAWRSRGTERVHWSHLAACRGQDALLFFPEPTASGQVAAAKRICGGCEVRLDCLRSALGEGYLTGIWGGTTEQERQSLRHQVPRPR